MSNVKFLTVRTNDDVLNSLEEMQTKLSKNRKVREHFYGQYSFGSDAIKKGKSRNYGISRGDLVRLAVLRLQHDVNSMGDEGMIETEVMS